MQAWWRLLRGLKPYTAGVVISLICALGVGLSYAAGVGTMLPVMKVFISTEGIHGWANRLAVQNRLHLDLFDLDYTVNRAENLAAKAARKNQQLDANQDQPLGLDVYAPSASAAPELRTLKSGDTLSGVRLGDSAAWARNWHKIARELAMAPAGATAELEIASPGQPLRTVRITLDPPAWHIRMFSGIVDQLPSQRTQALICVVVFFVFLCIVGSLFRYYQQYLGMTIANRVVMDVRRRAFDRITQLPTSYFAQRGTSDLTSRLTQDTNTLTEGVSMVLGKSVQEPIKAAICAGLALWINWKLCMGIVVVLPILGLIIRKFSKRMRRASRGTLENWSRMLGIIEESLAGMRVVKAYSGEGYERRRFARVNKDLLHEQTRLNHYGSMSRPTVETIAVILSAIPMIFAADMVMKGLIEKENFFTLLACFAAIMEPMRKLSDVNSKMQQSNVAASRVFEVIDMPVEPNYDHSLPHLPRHQKTIEFVDVTFNYPGHDEKVLQNVSLSVKHGQNVAVVGGNGSGKTTLLSLLPRLYVVTQGKVLIDGMDTATVSLRSLRKQIGLVTQDTVLFADTIYNNIAYGTRHATKEQVLDAARRSFADEFIQNLPEKYETKVGEHGVRLSGGQKQRIAIARAILHDPAILILDEAMSQIDADSEMKISEALREFMKNRTTFVIAHRFATVITSDVICCLDKGKVAGIGTHAELLGTCAAYRKLYETQFRDVAVGLGEAAAATA